MPKEKDFELRSEEVQEILSRVPHWMIRWGSVVILFILLSLFAVAYMIKYPDIVSTQIIITTHTPPQKVVARVSGKIESIFVHDKMRVQKNTPLAVIENAANYKDVFNLSKALSKGDKTLSNFTFEEFRNVQLGDVENAFVAFQKESLAQNLNLNLKPYQVESKAQTYETIQLKERLNLLLSQKEINQSELQLQKNDLDRYETLYKKGIIATQEIEKQRLLYLQSQKNYKTVLSTISQLKSSLNELNKNSKTNQINQQKENSTLERNQKQAFYQLKKAVKDWELNYVLTAAIEGKISFLQLWAENQTVTAGENVFSIIPTNQKGYIGKAKAPAQNSGKIKIGQEVIIRLTNFPEREFGILKGKVTSISLTPDKEGNLLLNISLPEGLKTSYHKKIVFRQEMSATADIITNDLRLTEHILYQFRDIFKR
jgi:multidrug resistance efflux pump